MTDRAIGSRAMPDCCLCGSRGEVLYEALIDPLYDAPGVWTLKRCPNRDCGLIWLDPMPESHDLGKAYQGGYYTHAEAASGAGGFQKLYNVVNNGYLRSRLGYTKGVGPAWYRLFWPLAALHISGIPGVEWSVMYLPANPGGKLLDIGFGDGALMWRFAELGWDVEGLDVDSVCVEAARSRGLNAKQGDLAGQGYPDDSFDCITMRHVQEHIPEMVRLFRECRRVLKPGGMLVSIMPNSASWEHRRFGGRWVALEPPRHLFLFGPKSLELVCRLAGIEVVKLFSSGQSAWASWIRNVMLRPERFWAKWLPRKIGALAWHFALRTRMLFDPWAGQEIVLIARK